MGRNKQVKLDNPNQKIRGIVNGEEFRIYFRKFRDKRGKAVRILTGPGLQNMSRRKK